MDKFVLAFVAFAAPVSVAACPDFGLWGQERYAVNAGDLYSPVSTSVTAGGNIDLRGCGHLRPGNWNGPMSGYVIREPDFSILVRGLSGYQIEFRTISACDSVLLINTAAGNWYFDDDDNVNSSRDARIRLTNPAGDGIYDIWVGTFDGQPCDADIIVETF